MSADMESQSDENVSILDSDEEMDIDDELLGGSGEDSNESSDFSGENDEPSTSAATPRRRNRSRTTTTTNASAGSSKSSGPQKKKFKGYDDRDVDAPSTKQLRFQPSNPPGIQLEHVRTRSTASSMSKAIDFFKLFLTVELVQQLVDFTNAYATAHIVDRPTYADAGGGWKAVTMEEFYSLIGLLIYMGLAQFSDVDCYWSTKYPYHGSWARAFIKSRDRFRAVMSFLHIVDHTAEDPNDPMRKVRYLLDHMKNACKKLYQPSEHISIDERMVRSKARFQFRQYIRDKPTKWGFKLWVLADSQTGYTWNFDVYIGKAAKRSEHGLSYDVVMDLCEELGKQGYKLFFDNFYTSPQLLRDLKKRGIWACGTVNKGRKGFPKEMKASTVQWGKQAHRGNMRWERDGEIVIIQWKDNKAISLMSSFHAASEFGHCLRRVKEDGAFRRKIVKQPKVVQSYNQYMGGVDKSDQLLSKYDLLRKTNKYWKTLFFHFIDIAVVNSYVLFCQWMQRYPGNIQRSSHFGQRQFREELSKQLGKIGDDDPVPLFASHKQKERDSESEDDCEHFPVSTKERRTYTEKKLFCNVVTMAQYICLYMAS
nr:piggyBac transposable element-derived protein 4-like [Lytechinus pictus]